ncbi:hypothetical protein HK096_003994 [Nowakowskiella sp. JEL0078]|nr:hypothetical protein HK096_003994 [Nowakowskiella sp. JEL0078]
MCIWIGKEDEERFPPYEDIHSPHPPPVILYSIRQVLWEASTEKGGFLLKDHHSWPFQISVPPQIPRPPKPRFSSDNTEHLPVFINLPGSECHGRTVHYQLRAVYEPVNTQKIYYKVPTHIINYLVNPVQTDSSQGLFCGVTLKEDLSDIEIYNSKSYSSKRSIRGLIETFKRRVNLIDETDTAKIEINVFYESTSYGFGDDVDAVVFYNLPKGFFVDRIGTALAQRSFNEQSSESSDESIKRTPELLKDLGNVLKPTSMAARSVRFPDSNPEKDNSAQKSINFSPTYPTTSIVSNPILKQSSETRTQPLDRLDDILSFTEADFVLSTDMDLSSEFSENNLKSLFTISYSIPSSQAHSESSTKKIVSDDHIVFLTAKMPIFSSCKCPTSSLHIIHAFVTSIHIRSPSVEAANALATKLRNKASGQQQLHQHIDVSTSRKMIIVKLSISVMILPFAQIKSELNQLVLESDQQSEVTSPSATLRSYVSSEGIEEKSSHKLSPQSSTMSFPLLFKMGKKSETSSELSSSREGLPRQYVAPIYKDDDLLDRAAEFVPGVMRSNSEQSLLQLQSSKK